MALEIEVKAWLDDPKSVQERLDAPDSGFAFVKAVRKEDAYFAASDVKLDDVDLDRDRMVRIRRSARDGGEERVELTAKVRMTKDGTEVNREIETAVVDGAATEAILGYLGLVPLIRKTKRARVYQRGDVTVEINELDGLGAFLECERVIAEDAGAEAEAAARLEVQEALAAAGVSADRIEVRRYIDLLRERLERRGDQRRTTDRIAVPPDIRKDENGE